MSLNDFYRDFKKGNVNFRKHDFYKSTKPTDTKRWAPPKPKQFYFVVPKGLLDSTTVPDHCGIIEVSDEDRYCWGLSVKRQAPNLKHATKLSTNSLHNIAQKGCNRFLDLKRSILAQNDAMDAARHPGDSKKSMQAYKMTAVADALDSMARDVIQLVHKYCPEEW